MWKEDKYFLRTMTFGLSCIYGRAQNALKPLQPHALNLSIVSLVLVLGFSVLFPTIANADISMEQLTPDQSTIVLTIKAMQNQTKPFGKLVLSENAEPRRTFKIPITAYSSDVGQTDDTPCITASGMNVCERNTENIVAANFLPMGTRVRIPEFYGNRVFYVQDRMNQRYDEHMDIWMKHKSDAKQFGIKFTTVEVF